MDDKGLRQGCPLSPLLFNILLLDIEEEMGKVRWGGVKIRRKRIYILVHADDGDGGGRGRNEKYDREIGGVLS